MQLVLSTETIKQFIEFIEQKGHVHAASTAVTTTAKVEATEEKVAAPKKGAKPKKETSSVKVTVDSASVSSTKAEDVFSESELTDDKEAVSPLAEVAIEVAKADRVVSKDEIIEALTKFNQKNGPVETRKLLIGAGVQKVSELKPEQYSKFYKTVEARLSV